MTEGGLTTLASPHAFAETAARLEALLDERGLTVFARIDHAAGARAAGLALRPTLLMIFGDARGGTPLMQAAPTAGLDLPLKILVWEDDAGQTHLTYREPTSIAAAHGQGASDLRVVANLAMALAALAAAAVGDDVPIAKHARRGRDDPRHGAEPRSGPGRHRRPELLYRRAGGRGGRRDRPKPT